MTWHPPTIDDVRRFADGRRKLREEGPDAELQDEVERIGDQLASYHREDCRLAGASRSVYECHCCHKWPAGVDTCRHCEAWIELRTDPTGQRGDAWAERDGWHDDRDFQCGWNEDGRHEPVVEVATCGACGRSWNDALITSRTPAPSARCPFEYDFHRELDGALDRINKRR